jgi:pilus assembly protein Flp/PilA
MTNLIKAFGRDEAGAAAAEYALILAVVGGGIAVAALALGTAISGAMDRATGYITAVLPAA